MFGGCFCCVAIIVFFILLATNWISKTCLYMFSWHVQFYHYTYLMAVFIGGGFGLVYSLL
jgi:hypothetical protein